MKPWLFVGDLPLVGQLAIPGYYFWLAVAFVVFTQVAVREGRRSGIEAARVVDLSLIVLGGAMVGGRLGHVLFENPHGYLADPLRLLRFWQGGFVYYGGFLLCTALMAAYVRWRRMSFWVVADVFAPALALALGVGRMACFSAGCCYGRPITFPLGAPLPWGVRMASGQVPSSLHDVSLHPTQLYLCLLGLVSFLVVMAVRRRQTVPGQAFLTYVALYAVGRSIVEVFRGDVARGVYLGGWLSTSQVIAAVLLTASVGALLWRRRRGVPRPGGG